MGEQWRGRQCCTGPHQHSTACSRVTVKNSKTYKFPLKQITGTHPGCALLPCSSSGYCCREYCRGGGNTTVLKVTRRIKEFSFFFFSFWSLLDLALLWLRSSGRSCPTAVSLRLCRERALSNKRSARDVAGALICVKVIAVRRSKLGGD